MGTEGSEQGESGTKQESSENERASSENERVSSDEVETDPKETIREAVWDDLEDTGVARFPFPPHGRIPNYTGAEEAADRLAETAAWRAADTLKANPDAPQLPVRRAALAAGKTVYMAVPRLREADCFLELDPTALEEPDAAATVSGMGDHGVQVPPADVEPIDLVVSGSVAVRPDGARIGKGDGYSDLEFAILGDLGLVDDETPVVTTVHERQVVDADWSVDAHDVAMDLVVTPERLIRTETALARPSGIDWSLLDDERITEMPVLERLSPA